MADLPTLIDSNVFIDLLRSGRDPAVELTRNVSSTDLATCGMVQLEVLRGVRDERVYNRLVNFFALLQNVMADARIWEEATRIGWKLDREGKTLPGPDLVIAASALRIGAAVLTNDRHFDHVPGLRVRRPHW